MSSVKRGRKSVLRSFEERRAALESRARNLSGSDLVGAYLRGQAAASAGLSCGQRDPAAWGESACSVCSGLGLLREVVRLYGDGGEALAEFVRVVECVACAGAGLDPVAALSGDDPGRVVFLSSLRRG